MSKSKMFAALSFVGALMMVSSALAMEEGTIVKAKIPFSFTARDMTFAPGNYTFTVDDGQEPGILAIESDKGHKAEVMMSEGEAAAEPVAHSKLVFDKIGDHYFLSEVWMAGWDAGRLISQKEIHEELAKTAAKRERVTIPLNKG